MNATKCTVYRSEKKEETYLYLPLGKKPGDLPAELQSLFGEATPVMMLDLSPDKKLSRVDVNKVLGALSNDGYFIQLPPKFPVEDEISRWVKRPG